jgi:hypothetical protein
MTTFFLVISPQVGHILVPSASQAIPVLKGNVVGMEDFQNFFRNAVNFYSPSHRQAISASIQSGN